ncbi:CPBP family intramembrane metalloprotease [Panacibacter ginsenosidivorans]|uniref:CPBP family intramembrane metalloprotease n=1 Tax=Panacibacter ginsenosidivorans TaxID=1813871 RepID=A0A5B8V8R7_9BACT|nr:CPBP family intramembrane glutamic endopeptidase [Panacibacter ginsenosidivorans]QEC67619.1 CPBP family intramembrane metalloprotease [Panacibacter ginsenosidivorans]
MLNNQKLNPVSQFALLIALVGLGMILLSMFTGLIANYVMHIPLSKMQEAFLNPENIIFSRLLQVFSSFLMWGVPALVVAAVSGKDPINQLGCNDTLSGKQTFFVVLMMVAGIMIGNTLAELNRLIPLTKELADSFQKLEDAYNQGVMSIANMKTTNDYIFSLMVLAVVPALFEEMFFRGCLQQIMVSWTRNAFIGIFITSFIFSAIHISFYGFLPRLFLGLLLGYIFYYSKNLWLSVTAHFINNAFSVTALYSLSRAGKLTPDAMEDSYPLYYGLIGVAAILALFIAFKKESDRLLLQPE